MSRIGRRPIPVPTGVDIAIDGGTVQVSIEAMADRVRFAVGDATDPAHRPGRAARPPRAQPSPGAQLVPGVVDDLPPVEGGEAAVRGATGGRGDFGGSACSVR